MALRKSAYIVILGVMLILMTAQKVLAGPEIRVFSSSDKAIQNLVQRQEIIRKTIHQILIDPAATVGYENEQVYMLDQVKERYLLLEYLTGPRKGQRIIIDKNIGDEIPGEITEQWTVADVKLGAKLIPLPPGKARIVWKYEYQGQPMTEIESLRLGFYRFVLFTKDAPGIDRKGQAIVIMTEGRLVTVAGKIVAEGRLTKQLTIDIRTFKVVIDPNLPLSKAVTIRLK